MDDTAIHSRREIETRFALRHKPTGRLLRLLVTSNHNRDYCNAESCKLSLKSGEELRLDTEYQVARVLERDRDWYNTYRDQPSWDGIDMADVEVVTVRRIMDFEGPEGCDPSLETIAILPAVFSGFAPAHRCGTRDGTPKPVIRAIFGVPLPEDKRVHGMVQVAILEPTDNDLPLADYRGLWVRSYGGGFLGSIVAAEEMPDTFPLKEHLVRRSNEGSRLIVALIDATEAQSYAGQLAEAREQGD